VRKNKRSEAVIVKDGLVLDTHCASILPSSPVVSRLRFAAYKLHPIHPVANVHVSSAKTSVVLVKRTLTNKDDDTNEIRCAGVGYHCMYYFVEVVFC
jgi:hypothetical protein